uniref:DOT1 domain-containing protein n=1 Tax=Entomoneis paludosa TaxID=265537 RepID=A0A7S2VAR4_9STRA
MVTILDAVGVQKRDEFLDIGSGHGMLVLAAALLYPHLQASRGVEIVPHLQEQALIYQQQLEEHHHQIKSGSDSSIGTVSSNLADIDLLLGNIYDPDPQLTSILKRTTIAVCFATTWSRLF